MNLLRLALLVALGLLLVGCSEMFEDRWAVPSGVSVAETTYKAEITISAKTWDPASISTQMEAGRWQITLRPVKGETTADAVVFYVRAYQDLVVNVADEKGEIVRTTTLTRKVPESEATNTQ